MKIYSKSLLLDGAWLEDRVVTVSEGKIAGIERGCEGDLTCRRLTAGLFDTHAHGGEGYYTSDPDEAALARYLMALARHGVTDVLLTIGAFPEYERVLALFRAATEKQKAGLLGGARIRGLHLEGPFVNPQKAGAMDAGNMRLPSPECFERLFSGCMDLARIVTLAPEREGAAELIAWLREKGIRIQLGHTTASCEEAEAAFALGANSLCHTFNACPALHHRQPGAVAAALLDDNVYCETICDLKHLHPAVLRMIYRMKGPDRMVVISDSGAPTGMPDGDYWFGGKEYRVIGGVNRAKDGVTLAGGACYIDRSVQNLIALGISGEHAFRMASQTPADFLGIADSGRIQVGSPAHLSAWTEEGNCAFSIVGDAVYNYR